MAGAQTPAMLGHRAKHRCQSTNLDLGREARMEAELRGPYWSCQKSYVVISF